MLQWQLVKKTFVLSKRKSNFIQIVDAASVTVSAMAKVSSNRPLSWNKIPPSPTPSPHARARARAPHISKFSDGYLNRGYLALKAAYRNTLRAPTPFPAATPAP